MQRMAMIIALVLTAAIPTLLLAVSVTTAERAEKIATSPELRAIMERVREAVIDRHTLITHRRISKRDAQQFAVELHRLASEIDQSAVEGHSASYMEVGELSANLKRGADALSETADGRQMIDGLMNVVAALDHYAQRFDHPGWRTLQEN